MSLVEVIKGVMLPKLVVSQRHKAVGGKPSEQAWELECSDSQRTAWCK